MPTPKQVRFHYGRLMRAMWRLQRYLDEAHYANVIAYEGDYKEQAPCWAMNELRNRVKKTTAETRAQALHDEVLKGIK